MTEALAELTAFLKDEETQRAIASARANPTRESAKRLIRIEAYARAVLGEDEEEGRS